MANQLLLPNPPKFRSPDVGVGPGNADEWAAFYRWLQSATMPAGILDDIEDLRRQLAMVPDSLPPSGGDGGSAGDGDKATFGIGVGGPQTMGTDLTPHYICRNPGAFIDAVVNAKTPPSGGPLNIDIERSTDQGATWASIFSTPLVVPDGGTLEYTQTGFGQAAISAGDLLRVDLLDGSAENAQDIEVVLRWR